MKLIRFEVGAFPPFVPSVYEQQPFIGGAVSGQGPAHGGAQPAAIAFGGMAVKQVCISVPARGVVPTWHDAAHLQPGLVSVLLAFLGVIVPVEYEAAKIGFRRH